MNNSFRAETIYKRTNLILREETSMSGIQRAALVLTIIGAINWGLVGFFQFDLVAAIFGGQDSGLARIIYGLVGLAGLINIGLLFAPSEREERAAEPRATR
jgi:uncharacterized protein